MTTDVAELCERLARALKLTTLVREELNIRSRDGEDHYQLIGVPCGFPVATFGDACDAAFDLECRKHLPALLKALSQQADLIEKLTALVAAVDRWRDDPDVAAEQAILDARDAIGFALSTLPDTMRDEK